MALTLLAGDTPDSGAVTVKVTFTALPASLLLLLLVTSCKSVTATFVGNRERVRATAVTKVLLCKAGLRCQRARFMPARTTLSVRTTFGGDCKEVDRVLTLVPEAD